MDRQERDKRLSDRVNKGLFAATVLLIVFCVMLAGLLFGGNLLATAKELRQDCNMTLPKLPGLYCQGRDSNSNIYYENRDYKIYIK